MVQGFDVLLRGISAWVAGIYPQHDVLHSREELKAMWMLILDEPDGKSHIVP